MKCPKCEAQRLPGAVECPNCGIIYEKYDPIAAAKLAARRAELGAKRLPVSRNAERPPVAEKAQAERVSLSTRIKVFMPQFHHFAATATGRATFGLIGAVTVLTPPRTFEGMTFKVVFLLLLILVLRKQPSPQESKVTKCPACDGQVAYGIKSCPHCGKSKPAPKKTAIGARGMLFAGAFCGGMFLSAANTPSSNGPTWAEKTAVANAPLIKEQAVLAIKAAGYWCDTLDTFGPMATRPGFKAQCNNYRYAYTIEQDGPRILVKPD